MLRHTHNDIDWLQFELLAEEKLKHGIFLRKGGSSVGDFSSLNLSFDIGDDPKHVADNLQTVESILGIQNSVWSKQCHGKAVREVDASTRVNSLTCDALTTQQTGVPLLIKHADCQGTLFYDPVKKVIGGVHSGWRGSILNIYGATVQFMQERHGTDPKDLLACVGPSLCPEHAEFKNYQTEIPECLWKYQVRPYYFDFWALAQDQLEEAGVLSDHIEIARISTYSNTEDYFSYRRSRPTGRHATFVCLE